MYYKIGVTYKDETNGKTIKLFLYQQFVVQLLIVRGKYHLSVFFNLVESNQVYV